MSYRRTTVVLVSAFLTLSACRQEGPTDETPEGATKLFLAAVAGPRFARDRDKAYELLAPSTKELLEDRARLASKQAGRKVAPAELIAIERSVARWKVTKMESRSDGDHAKVTLIGESPSQRDELKLERIDGHWRIILPR